MPELAPALFRESFDEYYYSDSTNRQIYVAGYGTLDQSWSGYALQRDGLDLPPFIVPAIATNGDTNVLSDGSGGAFRFWIDPYWSTGSGGPGYNAQLLQLVAVGGGSSVLVWSLETASDGSSLQLIQESDSGPVMLVSATIDWPSNAWHQVAINFATNGVTLYLDGTNTASGSGIMGIPPASAEVVLGSDVSGANAAGADFDEFFSFGQTLTDADVAMNYNAYSPIAALGPLTWREESDFSEDGSAAAYSSSFTPAPSPCITGGQVYLTNITAIPTTNLGTTVSFQIEGGQSNTIYDILTTTNLAPGGSATNVVWTWLGQGFTCCTYTFFNQPNAQAFYAVGTPTPGFILGWDSDGDYDVPAGLSNFVQVTGGLGFTLALLANGAVTAWGDENTHGQISGATNLSNVVAIAAGPYHGLALTANGTVTNWGDWYPVAGSGGYFAVTSTNLTNVVGIAAGQDHDLALLADGTVVSWGFTNAPNIDLVPSGLAGVIAIASGDYHNVALLSNGTVTVWGSGDTNWNLTNVPSGLTNVVAIAAGELHTLALSSDGMVIAWGAGTNNTGTTPPNYGQSMVPTNLSNVVAIAAGEYSSMALLSNGTVFIWGELSNSPPWSADFQSNILAIGIGAYDNFVVCSGTIPPLLFSQPTNTAAQLGGSATFTVQTKGIGPVYYQWQLDGTNIPGATNASLVLSDLEPAQSGNEYSVIASNAWGASTSTNAQLTLYGPPEALPGSIWLWGDNSLGQSMPPPGLTDLLAVTAGYAFTAVLQENGTVMAWGEGDLDQTNVPSGLSNVVAIAAGGNHTLALKSDGTVVGWGYNMEGQASPPSGLTNIIAIAAGADQSMALSNNGTVITWGDEIATLPSGLTNVMAIAAGISSFFALQSNGMVTAWGAGDDPVITNLPALSNVVAIAAGGDHALALTADGNVTAWGDNTYGQCNVPTNLISSNVLAIAAGTSHSLALRNDGTVVAWGDNTYGQTNVISGLTNVHSIAAGGYFSAALEYAMVQYYPIDVSKDLLLIYNTNSADSLTVLNYYLANRPGVSSANVLGIGYTNSVLFSNTACTNVVYYTNDYETIATTNLTNTIFSPIQTWLSNNPTKRPQYVILFLDLPSRVVDPANNIFPACGSYPGGLGVNEYSSVPVQINSYCAIGWSPFVTSINVNGTNDCIGYIYKLASIASNGPPGSLIISASANGYGNTNYYFDDTDGEYPTYPYGLEALAGVTNSGVPLSAVDYSPFTNSVHITQGTNVAGYLTWGANGGEGNNYYTNVSFQGNSSWYLIETVESYNGRRYETDQGIFLQWYSANAFGGTSYSNTPVGAVTHVDEPGGNNVENSFIYFGQWAAGKNFATCAWNSRNTPYFQAVGDPFVKR